MSGRQPATRRALRILAGIILGLCLHPGELRARFEQQPRPRTVEPPLAPSQAPGAAPFAPAPGLPTPPSAGLVDPPTPTVSVRVRVAATSAVGQELEYRIVVENSSRADAHHVLLRNPLPANVRLVRATPEPSVREPELQWKFETVAAGTSRTVVLVVLPSGEGEVFNTARVTFEHGQTVRTRVTPGGVPKTIPVPIPVPTPPATADLQLRVTGPAQAVQSDAVTFILEVTNAGRADAANVVLTGLPDKEFTHGGSTPKEDSENPLTWKLGQLRPGQTVRVKCEMLALIPDKTSMLLQYKAEVRDASARVTGASARVMVNERPMAGEAKLTITVTGPPKRLVGRPTTYQITVSNTGTAAAANLFITNEVPEGITFVGASQGGALVGNQVRWLILSLAAGGRQTVSLTLQAAKAGELINRASARADGAANVVAEARTSFEGASGLTVEIDKSHDPLPVGKKAIYTIKIINQGSAEATNLSLVVALPDELKPLDPKGPSKGQLLGQKVAFDPLEKLAAGGEAVYTLEVEALKAAKVRVKIELNASELTAGPLRSEESSTLIPDMAPAMP